MLIQYVQTQKRGQDTAHKDNFVESVEHGHNHCHMETNFVGVWIEFYMDLLIEE